MANIIEGARRQGLKAAAGLGAASIALSGAGYVDNDVNAQGAPTEPNPIVETIPFNSEELNAPLHVDTQFLQPDFFGKLSRGEVDTASEKSINVEEIEDKKATIYAPTDGQNIAGLVTVDAGATNLYHGTEMPSIIINGEELENAPDTVISGIAQDGEGNEIHLGIRATWIVDTTQYEDGEMIIDVVAQDGEGNELRDTVEVNVDNVDQEVQRVLGNLLVDRETFINQNSTIVGSKTTGEDKADKRYVIERGTNELEDTAVYRAVQDAETGAFLSYEKVTEGTIPVTVPHDVAVLQNGDVQIVTGVERGETPELYWVPSLAISKDGGKTFEKIEHSLQISGAATQVKEINGTNKALIRFEEYAQEFPEYEEPQLATPFGIYDIESGELTLIEGEAENIGQIVHADEDENGDIDIVANWKKEDASWFILGEGEGPVTAKINTEEKRILSVNKPFSHWEGSAISVNEGHKGRAEWIVGINPLTQDIFAAKGNLEYSSNASFVKEGLSGNLGRDVDARLWNLKNINGMLWASGTYSSVDSDSQTFESAFIVAWKSGNEQEAKYYPLEINNSRTGDKLEIQTFDSISGVVANVEGTGRQDFGQVFIPFEEGTPVTDTIFFLDNARE